MSHTSYPTISSSSSTSSSSKPVMSERWGLDSSPQHDPLSRMKLASEALAEHRDFDSSTVAEAVEELSEVCRVFAACHGEVGLLLLPPTHLPLPLPPPLPLLPR